MDKKTYRAKGFKFEYVPAWHSAAKEKLMNNSAQNIYNDPSLLDYMQQLLCQ